MANGKQSTTTPEGAVSRSGYNGSGGAILKGTIVKLVAAGQYRQIAPMAAVTDVIYGVAAEDIADGAMGLIYIRGTVPVLASAALTEGNRVTSTAAGLAVDGATGSSILGVAVEVGAASELTEVELSGPGNGLAP